MTRGKYSKSKEHRENIAESVREYWKKSSRENTISYRVLQFLRVKRVASFQDVAYGNLKNYLNRKTAASYLSSLTKQQYLSRTNFTTPKGRIYCIRGEEKLLLKYCMDHKLIPSSTLYFLKLLAERKAISSVELRAEGFDSCDLNFFCQKFSKESKILKVSRIENYYVFYKNEKALEKFKSSNLDKIKSIEVDEWKKRNEKGRYLEDVIEAFYQLQGFQTQKRVWLTTPITKERVELDLLCSKAFFPEEEFENQKKLLIAVQCKYWSCPQGKEHILNLSNVVSWSSKVRETFGSSILCDFWSFHISPILFKPSVLRNNSYRLFSSKEISYAFELVKKNKPEVFEKYQVKKEVRI